MTLAKFGISGVAALALLGLAACDNGPSAVRTRDRDVATANIDTPAGGGAYSRDGGSGATAGGNRGGGVDDNSGYRASRIQGQGDSYWAGSKKYPAAESASYHFEHDGQDFGAKDVKDYVAKAHDFIGHPPQGTETIKRPNGDTLYYNAAHNVFAVATRDGAPRTMFKPRDGAAYWAQQKDRQSSSGPRTGYRSRSRDDNGGGRDSGNGDDQG
jgi:hypothetical protein